MNIYYMNIEELPMEWEGLLSMLREKVPVCHEVVQRKLAEQKNAKDQYRSLGAYLLLVYAYDLYAGEVYAGAVCADQAMQRNKRIKQLAAMPKILKTVSGKPFFEGEGEPYFNISHSGRYVVCALSNMECGVDVQEIRTVKAHFAERFFSEKEQEQMRRELLKGKSMDAIGTEIWCKKESLGKYRGCGLKEGTASLDTETCAEQIRVLRTFEDEKYILSCCTGVEAQIKIFEVKYLNLEAWLQQI